MFRVILRSLVLIVFWLALSSVQAQSPLPMTVSNDAGRYWLGGHVSYALDRQGDWTLTDVMGPEVASQFVASPDEVLAFGYVDAVYWLRFDVVTSLVATAPWWLEIGGLGRSIDEIDVYVTDAGHQLASHFQAGDSRPFDIRQVKHHALLFPLTLQSGEPQTVYLRVKSNGTLQIPLWIWSNAHYIEQEHHDVLLEGLFYGALLIMILYNGFIYLSVRDSSYLTYVCYLTCVLLFAVSLKGLGFEYLWPDQPWWNNKSNLVFAELGAVCMLLFARSFLQTPRNTPLLNYLIATLILASIASFPFIVLASHRVAALILAVQYVLTVVTVVVAAVLCLRRGFKAARLYLLAWVGVLASIVAWILNSINVIHSYWVGSYIFQIGTSIQVLLFSFALADRITLLRQERESALKLQLAHSRRLVMMADMFEKFVPKQFLRRIAREGIENIQLGKAEEDTISVLFADIRGFTTLSESLTPQELLNFLNACFTRLDKVIHDHNGFIDKFMGDGVMALFEPGDQGQSAREAVTAAIEMQNAIQLYNEHRASCGYAPIAIGIGINTGSVIIGTVGSSERMDSTVLGDNVNVAARLQEMTKVFGVKILISEYTHDQLRDDPQFECRELGAVSVRGRQQPARLYEVMNADDPDLRQSKRSTRDLHEAGLAHFRNGDLAQAAQSWRDCLTLCPDDPVTHYWLQRCEQQNPAKQPLGVV